MFSIEKRYLDDVLVTTTYIENYEEVDNILQSKSNKAHTKRQDTN
jgi:hypothetical protein